MENQIYCGCVPSIIDGTEHILTADEKIALPDSLSWENSMPPVRNQGLTLTCVCLSLTGVLDYLHNTENNTSGICNNYSIDTLYNSRSNKPLDGMSIKEALHYLRHIGLNNQKIESYSKINSELCLKYALVMFGPCVGGLPCYDNNSIYFWQPGGKFCGGHCITFVGYTPTGFIIRNSWGTEWANNGYIEMSYADFNKYCFEAWSINI